MRAARDLGDEVIERPRSAKVAAVGGKVLRDEDDLRDAEPFHLREDRGLAPGALRAAEARDRAEPARAVASLGDLHVRPRLSWGRARHLGQIEARDP